jgi:hypothetical protein
MPSSSSLPTVAATLMLSLCASFTVSATATPVTPYNDALLAWHSPDVAAPAFFGSQRARELQAAGGALPAASTQHTDSGAWGSVSGLASADLSSGQLKTRAAVDFVSPPDAALYMQSNTRFGDGFRTTTTGGSPFAWVPGQGARFSLHLDGTMTSTQPLESLGGGAFLILTLFQPGTLTADQNGISGPNILKSYAYFLGNPNQNLLSCFQGSCVSIIPEATFTDFADGLDIVQDINPGGDFDWQVLLGSAAWLYSRAITASRSGSLKISWNSAQRPGAAHPGRRRRGEGGAAGRRHAAVGAGPQQQRGCVPERRQRRAPARRRRR